MLDVGASRSANRLPSLQSGSGESGASAILQNISTQLEVRASCVRCSANVHTECSNMLNHSFFVFFNYHCLYLCFYFGCNDLKRCRQLAPQIETWKFTHDSAWCQKQILFPYTLSPNSINEFILLGLGKSVRCRPRGAPVPPGHGSMPVWAPPRNPQSIRHGHQPLLQESRWPGKTQSQQRCGASATEAR
jgi:hypothetical protein